MDVVKSALVVVVLSACSSASGGGGGPGQSQGGASFGGAAGFVAGGGFVGGGAQSQGGSFPGGGGTQAGGGFVGGGGTAGGISGGGGASGGVGVGGSAGESQDVAGCDATKLLPVPDDPSVRGPWVVGIKTVKVGRLNVDVIYPAAPGSEVGQTEVTFDVRDWLPVEDHDKVPADHSPAVKPIGGKLFRDLPLDTNHGPYPGVIFIHGTASFRIASGSTLTHWASRGFVVLSADYPGLFLADQLNTVCARPTTGAQDIPGDVNTQAQALASPSGDIAFLAGHVDATRLAVGGHSQGGCVAATLAATPGTQVLLPMSATTAATAGGTLKSLMYISGMADTVMGYTAGGLGNAVCPPVASSVTGAYTAAPGPPGVKKRLVGITGGGHLVPTDLCQTNAQGKNAIQEAQADGVCGINQVALIGLPALFDCGTIDMATGVKDVNYASTAVLEETLHCQDRTAQFANLRTNLPNVGDFQEAK